MNLKGKVVLLTGASEGIGAACAREFRSRGARLILTARNEARLREAASDGDLVIAGDITDAAHRRLVVSRAVEHFGHVDVLVNNAGAGLYAPSWQAPMEKARALFDLNFFSALEMIQLVVPHMRERSSGLIVNVGSMAGKMPLPWFTLYSSSKFALGALSDGLRMELYFDGIQVLQVCPGYVKTGFQAHILGGNVPEQVQAGKQFAITADRCATDIANGIERGARTIVTPSYGWIAIAIARLFPGFLDRIFAKVVRKHGAQR